MGDATKPVARPDFNRHGIPAEASALVFSTDDEGKLDIKLVLPAGANPKEPAGQPSLAAMKAMDLLLEYAKGG